MTTTLFRPAARLRAVAAVLALALCAGVQAARRHGRAAPVEGHAHGAGARHDDAVPAGRHAARPARRVRQLLHARRAAGAARVGHAVRRRRGRRRRRHARSRLRPAPARRHRHRRPERGTPAHPHVDAAGGHRPARRARRESARETAGHEHAGAVVRPTDRDERRIHAAAVRASPGCKPCGRPGSAGAPARRQRQTGCRARQRGRSPRACAPGHARARHR